jgi:3-oxoadipate enol-lactonase/4-carboxymuconolactone decarboxylase
VRPPDWAERVQRVRVEGMAAVVEAAMARFFSEPFARTHAEIVASMRSTLQGTDPVGYAGCAAAIRDMNLGQQLGAVQPPVLLLSGSLDVATPFEPHGAQLLAALPHARHAMLPSAHLACLEAPGEFASAVVDFLQPQPQQLREAARGLYEAGLKVRREVLGDAWVDRALAGRTAFNADFQEMITRCGWQEIWSRPGLDRRTRRLLVLATTVALGRWEEFRLHVRAGLTRGGFSEEELREVLMQSALYAGAPAANTAFAEAATILRELQRPE